MDTKHLLVLRLPGIELGLAYAAGQGAIVFLVAMSGYLNGFRMIAKRLPDYHIRRDEGQFHFVGRVAGLQRAAQAGNLDTLPSGC